MRDGDEALGLAVVGIRFGCGKLLAWIGLGGAVSEQGGFGALRLIWEAQRKSGGWFVHHDLLI